MSDERIAIIQQGLASPFWRDYLLPLLSDRAKNALTALATKAAPDDDMKRGRFQAYQEIINAPGNEVAIWQQQQQAAAEQDEESKVAEYRAEAGHRSPFRQEPEVGETTAATG